MRIIAAPDSARTVASRSSNWACTVTSRAVVGSSATMTSGWLATAMATITRCRIPPDSWCGYCRATTAGWGRPTRSSSSSARRDAASRVTFW